MLFTTVGLDPYLFVDPDWKLAVAMELVIVDMQTAALVALQPLPLLDEMHALVLMAVAEHQEFVTAIDNLDAAAMVRAGEWADDLV